MLSPNIRCSKNTGQNSVTCRSAEWSTKGVATGCIYIYIYTPPPKKKKISNRVVHLWDINTCFEIATTNIPPPPNQIPGYATVEYSLPSSSIDSHITVTRATVRLHWVMFTFWICFSLRLSLSLKFGLRSKIRQFFRSDSANRSAIRWPIRWDQTSDWAIAESKAN